MNVTLFFKDSSLFITVVDTPAYTLTPYGLIMHLGDRFSPPPLGELEGAQ